MDAGAAILMLHLIPLKLVSVCLHLRYRNDHRVMAGGSDDPAILDISMS